MSDSSNSLEWVEYAKGDYKYACMGVKSFLRGGG